jgi:hypothetical protein
MAPWWTVSSIWYRSSRTSQAPEPLMWFWGSENTRSDHSEGTTTQVMYVQGSNKDPQYWTPFTSLSPPLFSYSKLLPP